MGPVQWGDVPTWVAAVFAGGAALFAYQTITSQREQIEEQRLFIAEQSQNLMLEREALQAAADERRVAQARQVRAQRMGITNLHRVLVSNRSTEPLYDVTVRYGTAYSSVRAYRVDEDGDVASHEPFPATVHLVGPGRTFRFESTAMSETTLANARPVVHFTDNNGVKWHLDEHGELTEITGV